MTAVLSAELERLDPPVTVVPDTALIVDATLIPTGRRKGVTDAHSGHRRRFGMTITVVCDLAGRILTASDPLPGGVGGHRRLPRLAPVTGVGPRPDIG